VPKQPSLPTTTPKRQNTGRASTRPAPQAQQNRRHADCCIDRSTIALSSVAASLCLCTSNRRSGNTACPARSCGVTSSSRSTMALSDSARVAGAKFRAGQWSRPRSKKTRQRTRQCPAWYLVLLGPRAVAAPPGRADLDAAIPRPPTGKRLSTRSEPWNVIRAERIVDTVWLEGAAGAELVRHRIGIKLIVVEVPQIFSLRRVDARPQ
jgi:hypothetical protein